MNLHAHLKVPPEKEIKINTYIGHTTTTLPRRFKYNLSDTSAIK